MYSIWMSQDILKTTHDRGPYVHYLRLVIIQTDDSSLNHLVVEVISLPSPLSNSRKHRVTSVSLGHVIDELLNENCLTYTCTSKQT